MTSSRHRRLSARPLAGAAALLLAATAAGGAARAQSSGASAASPAAPADFALKNGDRVVFYGDSITDQRLYTVFTEQYVVTRFPHLNVRFVHSGWGGDRVTGGGGGPIDLRLQRDVLPYKPTVMTIMLAMNDAGYRPFDQGLFDTYTTGYTHILDTVQGALPGLRLTLIVPSPYDDVTRAPNFEGGYNAVLNRYGDFVRSLAEKRGQTVAEFNAPMVAMLQKAKAADPEQAQKIIPDRVHPGPGGHIVMAEALLKAWNAPSTVARVDIDGAGGKVTSTENARVSDLKKSGDSIAWTEEDGSLPFIIDPNDPLVQLVLKSSDVTEALNQEPLQVSGLKPDASYTVSIDNEDVGDFTGQDLASGINLATLPTPMAEQSLRVLALTRRHNDIHFERWRTYQVPYAQEKSASVRKAVSSVMTALDSLEDSFVAEQRAAAQPVPHHYVIRPAIPLPTGADLAQGKPYVTSDPNQHGWGIGGLTDGSWEASPQHCFASNETPVFPKTATIDLGAPTEVGSVVVGVPSFGSTKTITVSVSADGKAFTDVGKYVFPQRHEQRHLYTFAPVSARYIRLTYPDHYNEAVDYDANFVFTTEAAVYAP